MTIFLSYSFHLFIQNFFSLCLFFSEIQDKKKAPLVAGLELKLA